ncbi:hypothetical protein K491DRAFT_775375 [Lophiostoma macrostomum CBS 122681]|uniref:Uncharacterized protein n=1 Tax=Lophiostoma macrostomum CBS 122681 TaxID=1314788 RepID=A0A6A6TM53_9PLEO|nr:hypothetical protein K491DRAFT_775375 [Lophiostoma macrostomum CBS 122681]
MPVYTLVFAMVDITPEDWSAFVKGCSMKVGPVLPGETEKELNVYILVHCSSHKNFDTATEQVEATVKTEFSSSVWTDIKNTFLTLATPDRNVNEFYFLAVDEQALKEKKVLFIEFEEDDVGNEGDAVTKVTTWRRHRIPYGEIGNILAYFTVKGGWLSKETETEYLEEEVKEST